MPPMPSTAPTMHTANWVSLCIIVAPIANVNAPANTIIEALIAFMAAHSTAHEKVHEGLAGPWYAPAHLAEPGMGRKPAEIELLEFVELTGMLNGRGPYLRGPFRNKVAGFEPESPERGR